MNRRRHELLHTVLRGEEHLPFLHYLSSRLVGGDQDTREDLMQEGLIALWREARLRPGHQVREPALERRAIAHRMFRYLWFERERTWRARRRQGERGGPPKGLPLPIETYVQRYESLQLTRRLKRSMMKSCTMRHRRRPGHPARRMAEAAACFLLLGLAPALSPALGGALGAQQPAAGVAGDAPPPTLALRIQLGEQEQAYPIDYSARWINGAFTLAPDTVRAVIEGSVRLRRGARYAPVTPIAAPVDETRVRIRMGMRADGMVDSELTLECTGKEGEELTGGHLIRVLATTRAMIRTTRDLHVLMTLELDGAAGAECPLTLAALARKEAEEGAERLGAAVRDQVVGKDTSARIGAIRQTQGAATSQHDSTLVALADVGADAARLEATPDTVRLRVGERLSLRSTHRVRAYRANGSEIVGFVPFYAIASRAVVRLSGDALVGVSAGTTSVTVRPLPSPDGWATPVQTSFVVEVRP